jgi:hypothetical protein
VAPQVAPKFATSGLRLHEEALAKAEADAAQASLESAIKEMRDPVFATPALPISTVSAATSYPSVTSFVPAVCQAPRAGPAARRGAVNPFSNSLSGAQPPASQIVDQSAAHIASPASSTPFSTAKLAVDYSSANPTNEAKVFAVHAEAEVPADCGYSPTVQSEDSLYTLGGMNLPMYGRRPNAMQGGFGAARKSAAAVSSSTSSDPLGVTVQRVVSYSTQAESNKSIPATAASKTSTSLPYQSSLSAFPSKKAVPLPAAAVRGPTNWLADFLDDDVGALETPDD